MSNQPVSDDAPPGQTPDSAASPGQTPDSAASPGQTHDPAAPPAQTPDPAAPESADPPAADAKVRSSSYQRAEAKRQEKLEIVREQVENGSLVIRQMTDQERERYPPRAAKPDRRRGR